MPTDQEINEFLCNACGHEYHKPTAEEVASGSYYQYEPNYTGDLNAMADVRRVIRERGKQNDFIAALWDACGLPKSFTFWTMRNIDSLFAVIDAPARVQAPAAYEVLKEKWDAK